MNGCMSDSEPSTFEWRCYLDNMYCAGANYLYEQEASFKDINGISSGSLVYRLFVSLKTRIKCITFQSSTFEILYVVLYIVLYVVLVLSIQLVFESSNKKQKN